MNRKDLEKKKVQSGLALALLCIIIVGIVVISTPKPGDTVGTRPNSKPESSVTPKNTSASSANTNHQPYKNGSYTATGTYFSPGGQESITVSLTLQNNIVVASNVVSGANDPTATSYQTIFISGYKKYVVGKKISSIKLSNVSGSSLTSQGFSNALKKIEQQAA